MANDRLYELTEDVYKELLDKFLADYNSIEVVWSNNNKGEFVYYNPPSGYCQCLFRTRDYPGKVVCI